MPARPLTPLVSEQEYLGTQYEPDCEFEDGALIERHVGTEKHSWMQAALAAYIFRRRKAWHAGLMQARCREPTRLSGRNQRRQMQQRRFRATGMMNHHPKALSPYSVAILVTRP